MRAMTPAVIELGRAEGARGEIRLRRRIEDGVGIDELVINGVFAMDSAETTTERALGRLAGTTRPGARVLVGGLGLGYTVAAVLEHDVAAVDVVELEPVLLDWARSGLTDTLRAVGADPRVRLMAGDVADLVAGAAPAGSAPGTWDAIVLDVDNGPDFLIHRANAALYEERWLRTALGRLRPGGLLAIWCQGPAPGLRAGLEGVAAGVAELRFEVARGERRLEYVIYAATAADRPADPGRPSGRRGPE